MPVRTRGRKVGSPAVELVRLDRLTPATVNGVIYNPVRLDDPGIEVMAKGLRETIDRFDIWAVTPLVVSRDDVLVSGHRRQAALTLLGIDNAPVTRLDIWSTDADFEKFVVAYNTQRDKDPAERIREEVVRTSPEDAHNALVAFREEESLNAHKRAAGAGLRILASGSAAVRSRISPAKRPFLDTAAAVIEQYREYWPLTLRQIHYRLLTRHVLRDATRPEVWFRGKSRTRIQNRYANTEQCYHDLSDLLVRARLEGLVPWESMHDPHRPRTEWEQWPDVGAFMREKLDAMFLDYHRNLLQSQPAYLELVVEKVATLEITVRAARPFGLPVGVGKGYTSVTCLDETADRFRASGKDRCILLIAGDLDPEGENIPQTWAACLRDEHGVENLTAVKVAVNPDHVRQFDLSPLPVKESSSRAAGFIEAHGRSVYELEAFEPDVLQRVIGDAIRGVLDLDLFEQERRKKAEEARLLLACRKLVCDVLKDGLPNMSGSRR